MTKTWQTKKKILRLIGKEAKTPGEISEELGLAPSTVSEHMEELERMGAVSRVDNPYVKKWKYYRQNPRFNVQGVSSLKRVSRIPPVATALAAIIGLAALLMLGLPLIGAGTLTGSNQVPLRLTDPPQVPSGTTALNITYSSLQAHVINGNTSGWVSSSGSGSVDLMTLINTSQVLGNATIPKNATIDMVRFAITSARIVINGTAYNVTVPSGQLTARVTGESRVNANSSVLIDMNPVVTTIFTQNSTVFVLVPSVKAVVVGNTTANLHAGARAGLTSDEQDELRRATPSINITAASLQFANNSTTFSVTVKNNANESVVIRHIAIRGLSSVIVSQNAIGENGLVRVEIEDRPSFLNAGASANASVNVSEDTFGHGGLGMGMGARGEGEGNGMGMETINGVHVMAVGEGHMGINANETTIAEVEHPEMMRVLVRIGEEAKMFRNLNFLVTSNGTLVLPFLQNERDCVEEGGSCSVFQQTGGYVLKAGASATFTFSGKIVFGNGHVSISPIAGNKYVVVVSGEEGARASAEVTATS